MPSIFPSFPERLQCKRVKSRRPPLERIFPPPKIKKSSAEPSSTKKETLEEKYSKLESPSRKLQRDFEAQSAKMATLKDENQQRTHNLNDKNKEIQKLHTKIAAQCEEIASSEVPLKTLRRASLDGGTSLLTII